MRQATSRNCAKSFDDALGRTHEKDHYSFRLFVTGNTPRSTQAIRNVRKICEEELKGRYDLAVIDIYQHPEHVKQEQIVVTPTLVRKRPLPCRKIIGDLSDTKRLLEGLIISDGKSPAEPPAGPTSGAALKALGAALKRDDAH